MLSTFRKIFSADPVEKEIAVQEIRDANFRRVIYITTLAAPINLFHIITFGLQMDEGSDIEIQWRKAIMMTHAILMVTFIALAIFAHYLKRNGLVFSKRSAALFNAVFLILPFWGVVTVSFDQWVTPSLTAFFITILVTATALLIRPLASVIYFLLTYVLFVIGISLTQSDPNLLLSNKVNGFGGIVSCIGLSILLWRGNVLNFRQRRLINQQKLELERKNEELRKSNATKDQLFSIISHDLRGPISSTLSLTELMSEETSANEGQKSMIGLLRDNLGETFKLLENLLYWSRTQTGSIPFHPEKINVRKAADHAIKLLTLTARNKNVRIENNVTADVFALADVEMLHTILRNILSNAIKFSYEGGTVRITDEKINCDGEEFIRICIADDGIGISPEDAEKIFQPGQIKSREGTRNERGSGLGLILCREFVEKHRGVIAVDSAPGQGSIFSFTLPAVQPVDPAAPASSS